MFFLYRFEQQTILQKLKIKKVNMPKIQETIFNETMQYIFNKKTDLKILLKSLYAGEYNTDRNWSEIVNDLTLGFELNLIDIDNSTYFVKIIT